MRDVEVTTQAQLDGLGDDERAVLRSGHFVLSGNARAVLRGNARAVLRGNARAVLSGNARAVLWDNARAVLRGNARADLSGNARAVLRGNARAVLWDNARADLSGNARADLSGNASAVLRDNARADLSGNARAVGTPWTVVYDHNPGGTRAQGCTVITPPDLDTCDAATWATYHGVHVTRAGYAVLFKAVDDDWRTSRKGWVYKPGTTVTAADFAPTRRCGQGLHLSPHPQLARDYHSAATRYVAVRVKVADLVPLGDKCKVPSCKVLREVTIDGDRVTS